MSNPHSDEYCSNLAENSNDLEIYLEELICPHCNHAGVDLKSFMNHLIENHLRHGARRKWRSSLALSRTQFLVIIACYAELIAVEINRHIKSASYYCPVCHGFAADMKTLKIHFRKVHLRNAVNSVDCSTGPLKYNETSKSIADLIVELVYHSETSESYLCPFCMFESRIEELKVHVRRQHLKCNLKKGKKPISRKLKVTPEPDTSQHMMTVKNNVSVADTSNLHSGVQPLHSEQCNKVTEHSYVMSVYLEKSEEHLELEEMICPHCNHAGIDLKSLMNHLVEYHLRNGAKFKWHLPVALSRTQFLVTIACYAELMAEVLDQHIEGTSSFCPVCGVLFLDIKTLKIHFRKVHLRNAVNSVDCSTGPLKYNETSKNIADLIVELVYHTKPREYYLCPFCMFESRIKELKIHVRTLHLKYNLKKCGRKHIKRKSKMIPDSDTSQHMTTVADTSNPHSGVQPLGCEQCYKISENSKDLKRYLEKSIKYLEFRELICPHCKVARVDLKSLINHLIENHLKHGTKFKDSSSVPLTRTQFLVTVACYAELMAEIINQPYKTASYYCPICCGFAADIMSLKIHFRQVHLQNAVNSISYFTVPLNCNDTIDYITNLIVKLVYHSHPREFYLCPFCMYCTLRIEMLKKHLKKLHLKFEKVKYIKKNKNRRNKATHVAGTSQHNIICDIIPEKKILIIQHGCALVCSTLTLQNSTYFSTVQISQTVLNGQEHCNRCPHCLLPSKNNKVLAKHCRKTHSNDQAMNNWLVSRGLCPEDLIHQKESDCPKNVCSAAFISSRRFIMGRSSCVKVNLCLQCNHTALSIKVLKKHVRNAHTTETQLLLQGSRRVPLELNEHNPVNFASSSVTSEYLKKNSHRIDKEHNYFSPVNFNITDNSLETAIENETSIRPMNILPSNKHLQDYVINSVIDRFKLIEKNSFTSLEDIIMQYPHCICICTDLEKHLRAAHISEKFCCCQQCDFEGNFYNIREHQVSEHCKDTSKDCETCDYVATSASHLRKHMLSKHKRITVQKRCCSLLRDWIKLILPGEVKENAHPSNYITEFSLWNLKTIKSVIGKKEILQCTLCDYKTSNSFNLRSHMIVEHTMTKPFICHCGFRALTSSNFAKHVLANHKMSRGREKKSKTCKKNLVSNSLNESKDDNAKISTKPNQQNLRKLKCKKKLPLLSQYLSFM